MSNPTDEPRSPTLTDLWNDRVQLGAKIDELLRPFVQKYSLIAEDVEIRVHYSGVAIRVKV